MSRPRKGCGVFFPLESYSIELVVIFVSVFTLVIASGCSTTREVRRVGLEVDIQLSGKWNDADSRLVSNEMISSCLKSPWIERFHSEKKRDSPVVVVGQFVNNTDEHINPGPLLKDMERAFIESGNVRVVTNKQFRKQLLLEQKFQDSGIVDEETAASIGQQIGADFILFGTINSSRDTWEGKQVVFYQVNLELHHTTTSEVVWMGDKKIKKSVEQKRVTW